MACQCRPLLNSQSAPCVLLLPCASPLLHSSSSLPDPFSPKSTPSPPLPASPSPTPLPREPPDEGIMCECLWSDPAPQPGRQPSKRGVGLQFGPDVTADFLEDNGLELVVRSHEVRQAASGAGG